MKKSQKKAMARIRLSLATAYRRREYQDSESDGLWRARVMKHIRTLGALNDRPSNWEIFGTLAWKFIPVAVAVVLLLSLTVSRLDSGSGPIMADMTVEDPTDYGLYAYYRK
ncbi:MAG: hypothetical protein AB1641_18910 [Thermodesulfobacteriota bacterium]